MIKPLVIGIFGSGDLGANIALFLVERGIGNQIRIWDAQQNIATGKTLDMLEASPVRRYCTGLQAVSSPEEAADADVVIFAENSLGESHAANRQAIADLAALLKGREATVIVAGEPVDLLTALMVRASGLPREAVIGVGCHVDALRLRTLIAAEIGLSHEAIDAIIVGPRSDDMTPLASYVSVVGIPIVHFLSEARLQDLFGTVRAMAGARSEAGRRDYYTTAAATCDVAEALTRGLGRMLLVSIMLQGEFDINGVAMSVPAIVGPGGILRIMQPRLTSEERTTLQRAADRLRTTERQGGTAWQR